MSQKFILNIVIILTILIIIAFFTLVYGMYLKISTSTQNIENSAVYYSLELKEDEKIKNIEVLDKNRILVVVENSDNIKGVLYNINTNKVISFIEK